MDYKEDMDGDRYSKWFRTVLLPAAKDVDKKSVIIMDRAGYHMMLCDDSFKPQKTWKKSVMVRYIIDNGGIDDQTNVAYTEEVLSRKKNVVLLAMCLTLYEKRAKRYAFQDWLKEFNAQNGTDIKGLLLPVAHPRLNPIEMCWGNAKNHVARSCHNFTMDGVVGLFKEQISAKTSGKNRR